LTDSTHVILEAIGLYSVLLTYLLCQAQVAISVINPKQSHHFAQLQLAVTKTDESNAVLLARYGQLVQPPRYTLESDVLLRLEQLTIQHFLYQLRGLTSIQGISTTIATALIEATSGFAQFHSAKALAKYIRVVPVVY
jgi:transposase